MPSPESLLMRKQGAFSDNLWQDKQRSSSRIKSYFHAHCCLMLALSLFGLMGFIFLKVHFMSFFLRPVKSVHGKHEIPCSCIDVDEALMRSFSKKKVKEGNRLSEVRKDQGLFVSDMDGFNEKEDFKRSKVLGFVGIQTSYTSIELRKAIRETWLASDPEGILRLEQATGLVFRFVIGKTNDSQKTKTVEKEMKKYNDFLRIDYEEEHISSAKKTLAFLEAAFHLFVAEFYVKADDNIYLRPDRLSTILAKERSASRTYIGCMKNGPVVKDPKLNWYEPQGYILGNEYFYHAYGSIYALSMEAVEMLLSASNESFRFFAHEDITIGSWMLALNVNHEDNKYLCDTKCTSKSIAVVDLPKCIGLCNTTALKVRQLHKSEKCSKTPTITLDSDDDIIV